MSLYLFMCCVYLFLFFFFNDTATTEIYTLSLHDALPTWPPCGRWCAPASRSVATSRAEMVVPGRRAPPSSARTRPDSARPRARHRPRSLRGQVAGLRDPEQRIGAERRGGARCPAGERPVHEGPAGAVRHRALTGEPAGCPLAGARGGVAGRAPRAGVAGLGLTGDRVATEGGIRAGGVARRGGVAERAKRAVRDRLSADGRAAAALA